MIAGWARSRPRRGGWLAALVLPLLVLPWLLAQLDARALARTFDQLGYGWVLAGVGCGLVYQLFRALRFGRLMRVTGSRALVATLCLHGVVRNLLPAWLGEAAGVWLFRRRHGVGSGSGGASIVLARTIDLAIVMATGSALVLLGQLPDGVPDRAAWGLVGALLAAVTGLLLVVLAERWLPAGGEQRASAIAAAQRLLAESSSTLRHAMAHRVLVPATAASALMWAAMYGQHYAFVRALPFDLSAIDVLWIQILIIPIRLLPLHGVADLGSHEAAWFAGATIAGLGASAAAALAVATHVLVFVALAGYAAVAGLIMYAERRRCPAPAPARAASATGTPGDQAAE
jgi:uncharacterized membrane protein YbhN (UPF0104 family)